VIIDASFPYKTNKELFICNLKIIDPSLHLKHVRGGDKTQDYANLVLYAKRFEDLPIVQRVGDIIRVHRAFLRLHQHQRQFNADISFNSSWALFSTDKLPPLEFQKNAPKKHPGEGFEFVPYAHSSKYYSFERHEKPILTNLRKWALAYFANYSGIRTEAITPLSKAMGKRHDFDAVVKIVKVYEKDEYTNEIRVKDQTS